MAGAVQGVGIIAALILLGWLLQRFRALPSEASGALASFAYWAATPALLFSVLSTEDLNLVTGAPLLVAAVSGVGSALLFVIPALLLRPSKPDLTLGAMGASLNNAAYIGLPIATFVLGAPHYVVPIMAFQLGFFTPMFFVLAELSGESGGAHGRAARVVKTVATNPLVLAAVLAVLWNLSPLPVPTFVSEGTEFLGSAAPPTVLVAFGASLVGQSARMHRRVVAMVAWASAVKLVGQPAIAYLVASLLGMTGIDLAGVTIMAALPTAQNAFIAATRAGAGTEVAQGSVLVTSALSLPTVLVLSALLL